MRTWIQKRKARRKIKLTIMKVKIVTSRTFIVMKMLLIKNKEGEIETHNKVMDSVAFTK